MSIKQYYYLIVLTALFFTGCSDPESSAIDLDLGEAILTIDNTVYIAEAILGTRTIAETEYEQISLDVGDSIEIDILSVSFEEGFILWDGDTFVAKGTRFYFTSRLHGGGGFGPTSGYLIINEKTDNTISGKFEMDLYNYASSCYDCFGNEVTVEGEFIALRNNE